MKITSSTHAETPFIMKNNATKIVKFIFYILLALSVIMQMSFLNKYYTFNRYTLYFLTLLIIFLSLNRFYSFYRRSFFNKFFLFEYILFSFLYLFSLLVRNSLNIEGLYASFAGSIAIYFGANTVIFGEKSAKFIKNILYMYIILMFILSINIFITYFGGQVFISSIYLFVQKNSKGPMIDFSIIFSIFFIINNKNKILKFLLIGIIVFEVIILTIMRSRADFLALYIVLFLMLFKFLVKKKSISKLTLFLSFVISLIFFYFSGFMTYFFNSIVSAFTKGYNMNNLNSLSAGRLDFYAKALNTFIENPLFGTLGNYYVDDSFLNWMAGYGLIGILIYFTMFFFLLKISFRSFWIFDFKDIRFFVSIAIITSLIISISEALPPFGPGTSYLIMWMMMPLLFIKRIRF